MSTPRDVIISAFACGGKMSCRKQAEEFADPPLVININSSIGVSTEGGTVQGFRKAASELRADSGSVIEGLFRRQNLKQPPRRVALVSYLDGWSFIHEALKYDNARIDTVIVLDGINTRSVDPWMGYAAQCLQGKQRLWMAATLAPHKTAKSNRSCTNIVLLNESPHESYDNCHTDPSVVLPEYITNVDLGKGISIYSKDENPKTKIFQEDTLRGRVYNRSKNGGSLVYLHYDGKTRQDQTYIQQYVQPRLWRWLAEEWKDTSTGTRW